MKDHDEASGTLFGIRDPEAAGKALAAYLEPRKESKKPVDYADQLTEVMKTLAAVSDYWTSDPQRMMEAQTRLYTGYFTLWASSPRRFPGRPAERSRTPG